MAAAWLTGLPRLDNTNRVEGYVLELSTRVVDNARPTDRINR
jgi:hypothetical protein